jgi:TetR/AcrR family transcriptional repressor of nem operon
MTTKVHAEEIQARQQQLADPQRAMMAGFLLSAWEGAILQAKVMKTPQPMRDFMEVVFATTLRS